MVGVYVANHRELGCAGGFDSFAVILIERLSGPVVGIDNDHKHFTSR